MAEHLEQKLLRLRARLDELQRSLPADEISLSSLLEIEALEQEISFLASESPFKDIADENIH